MLKWELDGFIKSSYTNWLKYERSSRVCSSDGPSANKVLVGYMYDICRLYAGSKMLLTEKDRRNVNQPTNRM